MQHRHLAVIFSLFFLLGTTALFAQTEAITITDIEDAHFPTVTVDFQLNPAVSDPQAPASYILNEDGQPMEILSIELVESRQPLSLLIVVDQGFYSVSRYRQDYDLVELKQIFYTLGNDILQEGDRVGILTGRWDSATNGRLQIHPHLPQTSDLLAYTQAIDALDFDLTASNINLNSAKPIETPELLEAAIDEMAEETNGVIIFISALIHAPWEPGNNHAINAAERLSSAAHSANLQFIVLQAAAGTLYDDIQVPMQLLADHYIELRHDRDNLQNVTAIYHTLWQNQTKFTATYRSSSASSEPRTVSLTLATAPEQIAQTTYTVAPQPPVLVGEMVTSASDGHYQLTANIDWPDQMPREVLAIQINDQAITEFTVTGNSLIATFTASTEHFAQIVISDELGLSSSTQLTLPDPPALAPSTTVPTAAPNPTPKAEPATAATGTQLLPWLPWLGLLITLGYIAVFQRQKLPQVGQQVRQTARRLTTIVTGNTRQPIIAHLHIAAAREELVGETVDLVNDITTLGRDPQLSDIQLYAEDEPSSISGQHCTIQFDQGRFHITDNGSANGTAVNGNLLLPDDPYPLNDGDEIQLGHKARHGATLHFTIAEAIKRKQRATIADAAFPGSPHEGKPTQTDLDPSSNSPAVFDRLPVLEDDDTWWKKLE